MDVSIGVARCLGNQLLEPSVLRRSALLLRSHSQSPGKTQWIFPSVQFTCQTTLTSISYATVIFETTDMGRSRIRHPRFQLWRLNSSKTYNRVERVRSEPEDETYTQLNWTVMPGDILGVYQPHEATTFLILQDDPLASSYFLGEQMRSSRTFDIHEEMTQRAGKFPLISIASGILL